MAHVAGRRRWWALGAMQLAVLAVGLDVTVLSVALPTLASALHASESDLQWFSSGYALVLAAAMLPAGLLGDHYGRKRVLLTALVLFGAGSAACAYAPSAGAFLVARLALGLAGAGVIVMAVSALTVLFSEEERPRAVAIWAAANFLAMPIGPILGGWLLSHYWWGWVFLINLPVAAVGFAAVVWLVPESRSPQRPALDPVGVLGSSAGLVGLTYGFIEAGQYGWLTAGALAPIALGLLLLVAFFVWERWLGRPGGGQPLVDLALFRSASFTWGTVLVALGTLALVGVLFAMPQYFQGVLGTDAMGSGLRLLPLIAGFVVGLLPAQRVASSAGAKLAVALGLAIVAAGLLVGAGTGLGSGSSFVAAWMTTVGVGMGLAFTTAASAALSELQAERSGVGSAMLQALKNVGAPFGAAILGSVLSSAYQARLHLEGLPQTSARLVRESIFGGVAVAKQTGSPLLLHSVRSAFVHGLDQALLVSAVFALVGVVLALVFLPSARRSALPLEHPVEEEQEIVGTR